MLQNCRIQDGNFFKIFEKLILILKVTDASNTSHQLNLNILSLNKYRMLLWNAIVVLQLFL
jgi:hypothetical protein